MSEPKKPIFCDNKTAKALYANPEIRKIINETAKRYATKRVEFREDLRAEGWMAAMKTTNSTEELSVIKDRAKRGVYNAYKREYRQRVKDREMIGDLAFLEDERRG